MPYAISKKTGRRVWMPTPDEVADGPMPDGEPAAGRGEATIPGVPSYSGLNSSDAPRLSERIADEAPRLAGMAKQAALAVATGMPVVAPVASAASSFFAARKAADEAFPTPAERPWVYHPQRDPFPVNYISPYTDQPYHRDVGQGRLFGHTLVNPGSSDQPLYEPAAGIDRESSTADFLAHKAKWAREDEMARLAYEAGRPVLNRQFVSNAAQRLQDSVSGIATAARTAMGIGRVTEREASQWAAQMTHQGMRQFVREQQLAGMVDMAKERQLSAVVRQGQISNTISGMAGHLVDAEGNVDTGHLQGIQGQALIMGASAGLRPAAVLDIFNSGVSRAKVAAQIARAKGKLVEAEISARTAKNNATKEEKIEWVDEHDKFGKVVGKRPYRKVKGADGAITYQEVPISRIQQATTENDPAGIRGTPSPAPAQPAVPSQPLPPSVEMPDRPAGGTGVATLPGFRVVQPRTASVPERAVVAGGYYN